MRIALLALVLLLSGASSAAAAATVTIRVTPTAGTTLGESHSVRGVLRDGAAALGGQPVTLEAQAAGEEAFSVLATTTTDGAGGYRFDREFDRNQRLRVSAGVATAEGAATVFPEFRLSARTVRRNVVRITQSFALQAGVPVRGRVTLYLGPARAATARFAKRVTLRRRGDRYLAQGDVRVPVRYKRRFAYAACLQVRAGSALGDPAARCPRRSFRF